MQTKQWIADLKMSGTLRSAAFSSDGTRVLTSGSEGRVHIWDLRQRSCMHAFVDEGCIRSTSLALSPNDEYVACGSNSGVVNLYDGACMRDATPTPIKAIMNLTTSIKTLRFNSDSTILAMASEEKRDAMRLVHLPSRSVFSNWPTAGTPLHYLTALDFSAHSGYLALGNDRGNALLYRLNHFKAA